MMSHPASWLRQSSPGYLPHAAISPASYQRDGGNNIAPLRYSLGMRWIWCVVFACALAEAAQVWTVRIEEPTGLYRRTGEVVAIPLAKLAAQTGPFTVVDPAGREVPSQLSGGELLFPVSLMPGDLPVYRVACCKPVPAANFRNSIVLRRLGSSRIEFGNSMFRAIIDTRNAAFVEVYS